MFLERILEEKRKEVARLKAAAPHVPSPEPARARRSLVQCLTAESGSLGIIAEVKKASPSKGLIRPDFDPVAIARQYEAAGAQAISVLTDRTFFQGDLAFLTKIREHVDVPLLRKDFIIDRAQIDESVAAGADAILLIAAALTEAELKDLTHYAQSCGLEVLLEIHTVDEWRAARRAKPDIIGINNRDLHTFEVSFNVTRRLLSQMPKDIPVISESGISDPKIVQELEQLGASGILVGEFLMRQKDVGEGIHYLRGAAVK